MDSTNSAVITAPIEAIETSQDANLSQYPRLSATEIKKVLYLSGMTDAGRFEDIIANTDTAGLLAMFGMSYAELKEVLAIPDDRLAMAPEKEGQPILDKGITAPPENISPYPALPTYPLFIGLENSLPIFSNTDTPTAHIDHSKTMLPVETIAAIDPAAPTNPETLAPHVDITDTVTITAPVSLDAQGETDNSEGQAGDNSDDPAIAASNLPIPLPSTPAAPLPPPGPGPLVVIPEALPPAPEPVVVPAEAVLPPAPGPGPVVVPAELVLPPAPGPAVVVADPVPSTSPPLSPPQTETSGGGQIETGQGGTGQTGGADGGSGFAGGTETGSKLDAEAGSKGSSSSSFSSNITGPTGLGLNGSSPSLLIGSESAGVVLGVAAGDVAHSISSGSFGFSFGGGGGGSHHQGGHDTHNDGAGPGITPLPPIIQIGPIPPESHVNDVINSPPDSPLPPTGLPGPGDIDGFIIDGVIDAVNQHGGDAPADSGGSDQGGQDHGHDGGVAHDNAPAPVAPPVDGNANVNGANAFIAHARAAITRMEAASVAAQVLVDEAADRYHEARHAINEAQDVIDEIDTMAENGVDFISTDYERLERANANIEHWTTILNTTNTFINDQQVFIHQQTAGINVMRALIAQTRAQLIEWGMQAGIADANANLDNAAGEDAANGGHADHFGGDIDIGGLPDGGNDGLNHAGDQPGDVPVPADEPDADLPPNIVAANEVIAQGNALIDAMRAHVALREAAIAQNETQIFDRRNDITWLQDSRIAGVEHALDQDGVPLSGPDLTNWLRSVITNTQAQISEAQADRNRTLNDIDQLQAQIAHAQAEIDAWFQHHQNNAPGEHHLPDVPQVVAPVDGALQTNALVHQDDVPASVQNTGTDTNGQDNQAVPPPQNISLALVPAAQTPGPAPAFNTAVQAPLHYGTRDLITLSSVMLAFEFSALSGASKPADISHRSNDIDAIQGVLAHWMDSIDPGFAATVVAFDKFEMSDSGSVMLQVLVRDMPVIPEQATLMALQNAMQDYLDAPDSPAPEHPANLDGTTHQALSLVGVESPASHEA